MNCAWFINSLTSQLYKYSYCLRLNDSSYPLLCLGQNPIDDASMQVKCGGHWDKKPGARAYGNLIGASLINPTKPVQKADNSLVTHQSLLVKASKDLRLRFVAIDPQVGWHGSNKIEQQPYPYLSRRLLAPWFKSRIQ